MTEPTGNPDNVSHRLWAQIFRSPVVGGLLGMVCMVVLFYTEENWRGARAWERCKRELSAQDAVLDQSAQFSTPIPDNLNVLKAPGMSKWFPGQGPNEWGSRLGRSLLSTPDGRDDPVEIDIISRTNQSASLASDLCLDYDAPVLSVADPTKPGSLDSDPPQIIPLIVMDSVPLSDAIKNLAREAGRSYLLDSNVVQSWKQPSLTLERQPLGWLLERFAPKAHFLEPRINFHLENLTALQALMVLLENYNLVWIEDTTNHIGRISIKTEFSSMVQLTPAAREQMRQLLARCATPTDPGAHTLNASQGFVLCHSDTPSTGIQSHHVKITVRSTTIPIIREVESFFPQDTLPRVRTSFTLRALPLGTNTFRVFASPPRFCSAEDYLAQTDPFKSEFDLMREALKRPYAGMNGDHERPVSEPPRNFVNMRIVSQALAQRAQSYLLLGQPEHALEELTLIHNLGAVVEAEPFSLVAAMIEGAITGLYVAVIHDGLRLGAWREPQLVALQGQLEKIHLGPLLVAGLSKERVAICRTIQRAKPNEFVNTFDPDCVQRSFWERLKSPGYCLLTFAPRGWRYQSMVAAATLIESNIACFDRVTQTLRPSDLQQVDAATEYGRTHDSPATRLAGIATPMFGRAWQAMAHNQSFVDQAFIACALERYRLDQGHYPPDLASLSPGFANQIPRHIIHGGQFHYRRLDTTHFTLYSVGWNGKDEGDLAFNTDSIADDSKGNWVWN